MEFILIVTKPQAVIWPFTCLKPSLVFCFLYCYKTASGNLAFHWEFN